MIKHIVMWKLKDFAEGADRKENALRLQRELEALKNTVPQIHEIEAGINSIESAAAYDVVLTAVFQDENDLDAYQKHPAHQAVAKFAGSVTDRRAVVDYKQ